MRDMRHINTGIYVKEIIHEGRKIHLRTTVRYHVPEDEKEFSNSVLTFQYIRESEYRRLRKKKEMIVYFSDQSWYNESVPKGALRW